MPERNRGRLGLEDSRVMKCTDRGDGFYDKYFPPKDLAPQNATSLLSYSTRPGIVESIRTEIEDAENPIADSWAWFIPRDQLSNIITFEKVQGVINTLQCCDSLSTDKKQALASEIYNGGQKERSVPSKKLFAILIRIGKHEDLLKLIKDGMNDSCLPIKLISNKEYPLKCRNLDHAHHAINKYDQNLRRKLSLWTYAVMAPFFWKPSDGHIHYILDQNDVLPIIPLESGNSSEEPQIQGQNNESQKNIVNKSNHGAFGYVDCVRFHPSHFDFGRDYVCDM
jgi:hypothetical protein